ncbi:hypothetical protein Tco_0432349 [Tanacetum coccineum]
MSPGNVARDKLDSDSDTVASPSPRAENEPRGQNELSRKQKMSADVARSHGGDGSGEDRPPPHHVPTGCIGKGKQKPNLGDRAASRLNTRDKTRNLSLKEIMDKKCLVPIRFELRDKQALMPLGDHAAHWSSYIEETQIDLRPHMESPNWTKINADIQQHLQKAYNTNKAAFKAQQWVIDPTTGTYNVEKIRRARPEDIKAEEWDKGRAQPLRSTRRSLTPSSWHTLLTGNSFRIRTDEEMRRLEAMGTYTDDEINHLARRDMFSQFESGRASESGGCGDDEESADDQEGEDEDGDGDI